MVSFLILLSMMKLLYLRKTYLRSQKKVIHPYVNSFKTLVAKMFHSHQHMELFIVGILPQNTSIKHLWGKKQKDLLCDNYISETRNICIVIASFTIYSCGYKTSINHGDCIHFSTIIVLLYYISYF